MPNCGLRIRTIYHSRKIQHKNISHLWQIAVSGFKQNPPNISNVVVEHEGKNGVYEKVHCKKAEFAYIQRKTHTWLVHPNNAHASVEIAGLRL
jgi:hypothetical protein